MSDSNGRKIEAVFFEEDGKTDPVMRSTPAAWFQWHEDYHGTYDVAWIVRIENGVETARFNPKFVASIEWAKPAAIDGTGVT